MRDVEINVPADAEDFELPALEVAKTQTLSGRLLGEDDRPVSYATVHGLLRGYRYGFGVTDNEGNFILERVPEGLELTKFQVYTDDKYLVVEPVTLDPLLLRVVRVIKK